jgi:hypothetical protein
MTAARVVWAGLQLLDRQIVDRDGENAGNVDDLELTVGEDGHVLFVTAIHSGPGALSRRLGWARLGGWRERMHQRVDDELGRMSPIPFERVSDLGSRVEVAADVEELPATATERWIRDHVIGRIPGSTHAPE